MFVKFGYSDDSDRQITKDGELVASLITVEQLGDDELIWSKFVAAGGDDSHSGYSWSCVKSVAAVLLNNHWKSVSEIPQNSPLYSRLASN